MFRHRQLAPMTRVLRAVSTTSAVTVWGSLIFKTRWIWAKSRCRRRKLPPVMRATAATTCVSGVVGADGFAQEPVFVEDLDFGDVTATWATV